MSLSNWSEKLLACSTKYEGPWEVGSDTDSVDAETDGTKENDMDSETRI